MRKIQFVISLLAGLFISYTTAAQKDASSVVIIEEPNALFSDNSLSKVDIRYPLRRVYKCIDSTGFYFIVLAESNDSIAPNGDTLHYNLKATKLTPTDSGFRAAWSLRDNIDTNRFEKSIWFWTKYWQLSDIDSDGMTDPIIVYGSSALNGTSDGSMKILIYYKDRKVAIRHQNGVLDFERNTRVDRDFYTLPHQIQTSVRMLITQMESDDHIIFPYRWEDALDKKKLYFDEN